MDVLQEKGRKFFLVLKVIAPMAGFCLVAGVVLAAIGKDVPTVVTVAGSTLTAGLVGYIGVNVWQKVGGGKWGMNLKRFFASLGMLVLALWLCSPSSADDLVVSAEFLTIWNGLKLNYRMLGTELSNLRQEYENTLMRFASLETKTELLEQNAIKREATFEMLSTEWEEESEILKTSLQRVNSSLNEAIDSSKKQRRNAFLLGGGLGILLGIGVALAIGFAVGG